MGLLCRTVLGFESYSFREPQYRKTKAICLCQCCLRRVALADTHSSSDFFGNDDSSEVVNATYNSGCFHLYKFSLISQICNVSICKTRRFILDLFIFIIVLQIPQSQILQPMSATVLKDLNKEMSKSNKSSGGNHGSSKHRSFPFDRLSQRNRGP